MGDQETVVDFAFAVHALATLGFAHQLGKTMFEHAGTDAAEHVGAALAFQHDGVNAFEVQQLREHEPGWAAADDANLCFHNVLLGWVKWAR